MPDDIPKEDNKCVNLGKIWDSWRVSCLLLAGSMYDAHIFLEAGFRAPGVCTYSRRDDDITPLPGCYMVNSVEEAVELVKKEKSLDLVICSHQVGDLDGFELARMVEQIRPKLPIILITNNEIYGLSSVAVPKRSLVDRIFSWYGNPDLIHSILQLVEDHANADRDILERNMRWVLLVEDEPNFFSHYLVMIHKELRERSLDLIPESANPTERAMRIRQMPKLLLAENCEEANRLFKRYGDNLIGVITDLQFPMQGKIDPKAGLKLAEKVKKRLSRVPVILQSLDPVSRQELRHSGVFFVNKDTEGSLLKTRKILLDEFGFGDFIFRMPGGEEVGRASSLGRLVDQMQSVPLDSFFHHGRANHFSTWLYLHGRYELAELLRPISAKKQGSGEELRQEVLQLIRPYLVENDL